MDRKGVSPVVATMLLLALAMSASVALYNYINSSNVVPDTNVAVSQVLESLKAVEVRSLLDESIHVFIQNTGDVNSTISVFYVSDGNGILLEAIPVNIPISVGQTKDVVLDGAGQNVWSWCEITGVTQRGNKVEAALYGTYLNGFVFANGLGPKPGKGQVEYVFHVSNITVNGAPVTDPSVYAALAGIDNSMYNVYTKSEPIGYPYAFTSSWFDDDQGTLVGPKNDVVILSRMAQFTGGHDLGLHMHQNADGTFSEVFVGIVANPNYSPLYVNLSLWDEQKWTNTMTVQFYNWASGQYMTSGDGYNSTVFNCNGGFSYNYGFTTPNTNLVSGNGTWEMMINVTAVGGNGNINAELGYLAVQESKYYVNGIETVFYFNMSGVNTTNVGSLVFSLTGIFPPISSNYYFDLYNFNSGGWENDGIITGNAQDQTAIIQIVNNCPNYIASNGIVAMRVFPQNDLPSGVVMQVDQARLIVRTLN